MLKKFLLSFLIFLYLMFNQQIKQLPVIGPFIGFLEFLLIVGFLIYVLYQIGVSIYLWFKVGK